MHSYEYCLLQNGYLERLNDIIIQNSFGKVLYSFFT